LLNLLKQGAAADEIQREKNTIVQHVFIHGPITKAGALGHWAGHRLSGCGFYQQWRRARIAGRCPGGLPLDFREGPFATWSEPAFPSASH
jgi:hypothetical protein